MSWYWYPLAVLVVLTGALPLVSRRWRKRFGAPVAFWGNRDTNRGYRRARNWMDLGLVFMGSALLFHSVPTGPWLLLPGLFGLAFFVCTGVFFVQVWFNWPKVWIPDDMRDDEGSFVAWAGRMRQRLTRRY